MKQQERIARYKRFKDFEKRILVATDLFGRGMDIERVNIVVNYDFPKLPINIFTGLDVLDVLAPKVWRSVSAPRRKTKLCSKMCKVVSV